MAPGVPAAADLSTLSEYLIRRAVEKHLDIESVDYPSAKEFKITRDGKTWLVEAPYDDQAPLFSNVFLLVSFDKSVTLGGGGGAAY